MSQVHIFILHGWAIDPNNEAKWESFRSQLQEKGITSTFLGIPGLTTELNEVWELEDYVNWLGTQLPEQPVILLGHSFGGQISSRFAAQNPDRVEKLILVDSAGIRDTSALVVLKRTVFRWLASIGKRFTSSESARTLLHKLARERDYLTASPIQRRTMANVLKDEVLEDLPNIQAETLIIWGSNDGATPVHLSAIFREEIEYSHLHIIEGARHSPQFTHTQKTVQLIEVFIRGSLKEDHDS